MNDTITFENIILSRDTLLCLSNEIENSYNGIDNNQIIPNLITILLAFIAAFIALFQVKSNVISSSRIKWIEDLRTTLSEYTAEVNLCTSIILNMRNESLKVSKENRDKTIREFYPNYIESSRKIDSLGNKVLLHLNSDKLPHKIIEKNIAAIYDQLHKNMMVSLNQDLIEFEIAEIIKNAKIIFKTEWEKSKKIYNL